MQPLTLKTEVSFVETAFCYQEQSIRWQRFFVVIVINANLKHFVNASLVLAAEAALCSKPPQETVLIFPHVSSSSWIFSNWFCHLITSQNRGKKLKFILNLWKYFRPWSGFTFIYERRYKHTSLSQWRKVCRYDVHIELNAQFFSFLFNFRRDTYRRWFFGHPMGEFKGKVLIKLCF